MSKKEWRKQKLDIFEQDSEQEQGYHQQDEDEELNNRQDGQVVSPSEEGEVVSRSQPNQGQEHLYDSSVDDQSHLEAQKRKRELRLKQREEEEEKMAALTEEDILKKALVDMERTNKRVMLMRKKNIKRIEDMEKVRMTQQPYLTSTNTHFRGSPSEYPLITTDRSGKTLFHPNYSLRINQMKLGDFIQKNIREESTANYLNEVVKFQNYAYQQRKKRRQHIQM